MVQEDSKLTGDNPREIAGSITDRLRSKALSKHSLLHSAQGAKSDLQGIGAFIPKTRSAPDSEFSVDLVNQNYFKEHAEAEKRLQELKPSAEDLQA